MRTRVQEIEIGRKEQRDSVREQERNMIVKQEVEKQKVVVEKKRGVEDMNKVSISTKFETEFNTNKFKKKWAFQFIDQHTIQKRGCW